MKESALSPADRRLCEWAEEQRREVMRLAVRFERRLGPAPKKARRLTAAPNLATT